MDIRIWFDLNGDQPDNSRWREIVAEKLKTARIFEIHCWGNTTKEIGLALQHGTVKPFGWQYGTVIEGTVTPVFMDMLLQTPKPVHTVFSNKMTPFFTSRWAMGSVVPITAQS